MRLDASTYHGAPSAAPRTPARRILGLNGLRAVAILLVFLQHKAPLPFLDLGRLGVWIFFALSGYLIVGILNNQRVQCDAGQTSPVAALKRFFYRRTIRIFPIYYLVIFICVILLTFGHFTHDQKLIDKFLDGYRGLFFHAIYVSNLWMGFDLHQFPGNLAHFWSLSVEEQFYLLFAPMLLLLRSRYHVRVCILAFIVCASFQIILVVVRADPIVVATFSINNFAVMLAGALGYFANRDGWSAVMGTKRLLGFSIAICVLSTFEPLALWSHSLLYFKAAADILLVLAAAHLVVWIARNQSSRIISVLEWAPIEYLGRISYGFYLYHNFVPVLTNGGRVTAKLGLSPDSLLVQVISIPLTFVVTVGIAYASWRLIELPMLSLKERPAGTA